jgi:hypothetical protein
MHGPHFWSVRRQLIGLAQHMQLHPSHRNSVPTHVLTSASGLSVYTAMDKQFVAGVTQAALVCLSHLTSAAQLLNAFAAAVPHQIAVPVHWQAASQQQQPGNQLLRLLQLQRMPQAASHLCRAVCRA